MRVGVVIATVGRAAEARWVLERLAAQTAPPIRVVLSAESPSDIPDLGELASRTSVLLGPRGLCAQRNRGMATIVDDCDVVVFYDDDFLPSRRSLERLAAFFATHRDIVGATGLVLADGVTRGGILLEAGQAILEGYDAQIPEAPTVLAEVSSAYGCNMAYRTKALPGLAFDERLPLYGWQEDVDFAGQIARRGRVVKTDAFAGVHLGVVKSRTPGLKLGFSQMVNPVYLVRKGTMRPWHAARIMSGNLLANHLRALVPEPYIDRRGRLTGNWVGLLHLASGRLEPERICTLP